MVIKPFHTYTVFYNKWFFEKIAGGKKYYFYTFANFFFTVWLNRRDLDSRIYCIHTDAVSYFTASSVMYPLEKSSVHS